MEFARGRLIPCDHGPQEMIGSELKHAPTHTPEQEQEQRKKKQQRQRERSSQEQGQEQRYQPPAQW
jgi:hypothetical protein